MKSFILAFIPIFVAVDALGTLPIFISLTEDLEERKKREIIYQSVLTAALVGISFIFIGKGIFALLGITVADFMVAGGILLLGMALMDLLTPEKTRKNIEPQTLGVVPLGTPLMVGPAVLTTILMLVDVYGLLPTLLALLINILLAGLIFLTAEYILRMLGRTGIKAISRVTSILLAAIAVMLIRKGLSQLIG